MNANLLIATITIIGCLPLQAAEGLESTLPTEMRVKHRFGDSVQPAFEGWARLPDGKVRLWFGYFNRNTEERLNVPVGADNRFEPGMDRGQPAYFYPGFHQFVFSVDLPSSWDKDARLVWTLKANGVTLKANGWMAEGYEVDTGVISMNLSPGGNTPGNQPPVLTGLSDQTIEMGKMLKLAVTATDDGLPVSRRRPGGANSGRAPRIRFEEYRGPGDANFDPLTVAADSGESMQVSTQAGFSKPGLYWIRAIGFDGQLEGIQDFKVTVTPAP